MMRKNEMPMIDDELAGYVVYRRMPMEKSRRDAKYYVLWCHDQGMYGFHLHATQDEAEEEVFLDLGKSEGDGYQKQHYVIQAVYWKGQTVMIPNSIPGEVK